MSIVIISLNSLSAPSSFLRQGLHQRLPSSLPILLFPFLMAASLRPAQKAFAGYIFPCNHSTISDLDRNIFGLPAKYEDSVRAIRKGMPLFLYNYSNRCLYGVFEAASDGGFNIDPYAWESTRRYGRPVSRYPAQVRVRIREARPGLEEEFFRPIVDCVDGSAFELELTARQVLQLLRLFNASLSPEEEVLAKEVFVGKVVFVGRNRQNRHTPSTRSHDPESPRATYKSDSEYHSDCSSSGMNSGEDDSSDESLLITRAVAGSGQRFSSPHPSAPPLAIASHTPLMAAVRKQQNVSRSDFNWRVAKAQNAFAGYIFFCNHDTIADLDRNVFGLPAKYEEPVRAIRKGMPLFLYNYSNRCLYGVFEAASDGGFNIDPYAWESTRRYGRPVSRYPAQVRVRIREIRPALEEEFFRPVLGHLDGSRFKLDLTAHQVLRLLRLFNASLSLEEEVLPKEVFVGKNGQNRCIPSSRLREPESPRGTDESDSESDCSSRDMNSGEDDWPDESPCDKSQYHQEDEEGKLSVEV